ncbi:ATP-binding protein [Amycolatopsis sp. NPDC059027]|uniref:ATP-binding protein n=1 Tax=Amycolatopsis sp. NPDC059027 TaxID=3346709 RepID=UPI0036734913
MHTGDSGDRNEESAQGNRSEVFGAEADIVQAGAVHGGVHFHGLNNPPRQVPRQLPGDVGGFVNRSGELARLGEALAARGEPSAVGVYIITGTAGVGKTSLALHWAHSARHRFPDGQLYVNLRGYDPGPPVSPEQALDRFLRALGVPPEAIPAEREDKAALYRSTVAERRVLIVLDNAATVGQIRPLLPGDADCLVLVTSRNRLSGLVARDGARRLALNTLSEVESVDLLRTVTAGYRRDDDPAELVELARLCARLPLALRIAAERASSRPLMLLGELIADLRDESVLWDALTAENDEESDAVRTVFAWSYRALPEDAARMFRLLGLHPGPEVSSAAAAALAGTGIGQARSLLDALVGAHMLEQRAPGRYEFHDLLRAYATDQAMRQETAEARRAAVERVVTWYVRTARAAVAVICPLDRDVLVDPPPADVVPLSFADYGAAFRWYEEERANFVAATRAAAEAGLHRLAWQLPAVLWSVYALQNPFEDWIATGRVGLDSARHNHDRFGEAQLLASLGMAFLQSQQLDRAEEYHRSALAVRADIGDRLGVAMSTNDLGILADRRHQLLDAQRYFADSVAIFRELGDRANQAWLLSNLGMVQCDLDLPGEAVEMLRESVAASREVGDRAAESNALMSLAIAYRERGRLTDADSAVEAALALAREDSYVVFEAVCFLEMARISRARGNPADALTFYQKSASIQRRLGDRSREAKALDGTGEAYQEMGRYDEAAKFHRLAVAFHRELGDRWQLALALHHLATALRSSDDPAPARAHWTEASALLAEFGDPKAVRIRARVDEILTGHG